MPMYEYRCKKCGAVFEELIRNADDEKQVKCRSCGHEQVERVLSMFSGNAGAPSSTAPLSGGSCAPRGGFS